MYNFRKICREKNNTINFKNEYFFKGNEVNYDKIKRKKKIDNSVVMPSLLDENINFI
jgi:hypothetical protein